MRRLIFYLACVLLCSCDPIWVFKPPYNSHLFMQNDSSQELFVFVTINEEKKDGRVLPVEYFHRLRIGGMCHVNNNLDNQEGVSKEDLFALLISDVSNIKITNADKSVILREFVKDANEIIHNPYEESSWEYEEYTEQVSDDYFQIFKSWYYTITDADLVVTE